MWVSRAYTLLVCQRSGKPESETELLLFAQAETKNNGGGGVWAGKSKRLIIKDD